MKDIDKFPSDYLFELLEEKCSDIIEFSLSTYIEKGKDFDLVIVLKNKEDKLFVDLDNIRTLLNKLEEVSIIFAKKLNINLAFFTSYRLQNYFGDLQVTNLHSKLFKVHLLAYPSPQHLLNWEPPSIILSLVYNHTRFIGNNDSLETVRQQVVKSSTIDRIQPLLQLLSETFLNISLNKNKLKKESTAIKDSIEKLNYIKRFLLWELVLSSTGEVPKSDYTSILNEASKYRELDEFVSSLKETYLVDPNTIKVNEIPQIYYSFIELIDLNKRLFTKDVFK